MRIGPLARTILEKEVAELNREVIPVDAMANIAGKCSALLLTLLILICADERQTAPTENVFSALISVRPCSSAANKCHVDLTGPKASDICQTQPYSAADSVIGSPAMTQ